MTTQTYQQDSERFLAQARAELFNGVLAQALEKGWGTAAQMVKAISEQRGWRHRGHALLFEAVDTLADEAGDQDIACLFDVASALHVDFYENWRSATNISRGLNDVEAPIDKLSPLLH